MVFKTPSRRTFFLFAALVLAISYAFTKEPARRVPAYVKAPDAAYAWEKTKEISFPGTDVAVLRLTSQKWQGITWKHWLSVIRPEKITHPDYALLLISGGSSRSDPPVRELAVVADIAKRAGTVAAVLNQVPNQPLYNNLYEDALISHTFVKYLETGDASWPCLLPMVKSVQRGMDAVQEYVSKTYSREIKKFVLTGASKRGWTTWLTGAMDARACAIAPMVIDTLNLGVQMEYQLACWGKYSRKIHDYSDKGLPAMLSKPPAQALIKLVDPYAYRSQLTMPKLILIGTNDPYWPVDAVNNYFTDLKGKNYIHYVPNAGHGLGASAITAISGFYQQTVLEKKHPDFTWRFANNKSEVTLSINAADAPQEIRLWSAQSPDRDFRDAKWTEQTVSGNGKTFRISLSLPADEYCALYGELMFKSANGPQYGLCTNIRVFKNR